MARFVIIALVAIAAGATVIIEQPASSLMNLHPKFEFMEQLSYLGIFPLHTVKCWMGMYGASTPKPTKLWTTSSWAQQLNNVIRGVNTKLMFRSDAVVVRSKDENGVNKVRASSELKMTQRYPWGFADEILTLWLKSTYVPMKCDFPAVAEQTWDDANLDGPKAFLASQAGGDRAVKARVSLQ